MALKKNLPLRIPLSTLPDVELSKRPNKILYGDDVLIDLTTDTVDESKVLTGYTFHKPNGTLGIGQYVPIEPIDLSSDTVTADVLLTGYTAHDKDKNAIVGTFTPIVKMIPDGNDLKWRWDMYSTTSQTYPTVAYLNGLTIAQTRYYADSATSISMKIADSYSAKCTAYGYSETNQTVTLAVKSDDGSTLTINDVQLGTIKSCTETSFTSVSIKKGWNKIEVCYEEGSGGDGWYVNYSSKRIAASGLFTYFTSQLKPVIINLPGAEEILINYEY